MLTFSSIEQWQTYRQTLPEASGIGFVPTMGNLHAGHLSLMHQSQAENEFTIASIFVNPTQFNREDDFLNYPKTLSEDIELLHQAGVHACLLPDEKQLYPDGYRYQVHETKQSLVLEGAHRPGHFTGVLTVVLKLLLLVRPTSAYFGEKDYQQFQLIKDMAKSFFLPTTIKSCATVREISGLALSSRNNRLNPAQKKTAQTFAHIFHQPRSCEQIKAELHAMGIKVEYVEDYQGRRFAAVDIDGIRLIDNYGMVGG